MVVQTHIPPLLFSANELYTSILSTYFAPVRWICLRAVSKLLILLLECMITSWGPWRWRREICGGAGACRRWRRRGRGSPPSGTGSGSEKIFLPQKEDNSSHVLNYRDCKETSNAAQRPSHVEGGAAWCSSILNIYAIVVAYQKLICKAIIEWSEV